MAGQANHERKSISTRLKLQEIIDNCLKVGKKGPQTVSKGYFPSKTATFATRACATFISMNEAHIAQQRRELLSKAIDHLTHGDRSAFGRRLGFMDYSRPRHGFPAIFGIKEGFYATANWNYRFAQRR